MKKKTISTIGALLSAILILALGSQSAQAVIPGLEVTNLNDSGEGSLREALANAEDGYVIFFSSDLQLPGTIQLNSPLAIDKNVHILGPGAALLTIDGMDLHRVFYIEVANPEEGETTIEGITIARGWMPGEGAGIFSRNTKLILNQCAIRDNRSGNGAGIHISGGNLVANHCTINGNWATASVARGGGLYLDGTEVSILNNCTFNENRSNRAAAAIYSESSLVLNNCTISGNTALAANGILIGNISFPPDLLLNSCTIHDNALDVGYGRIVIGNSIFNGQANLGTTEGGKIESAGFNLSSHNSSYLNHPTDIKNADPMLGPLQNNGGLTWTHALLPGSPAIDRGNRSVMDETLDTDQRGFARPYDHADIANAEGGDGSDIGAFELHPEDLEDPAGPQPQGYWKDNPDLWPVAELPLGCESYTASELFGLLNSPTGAGSKADASLILAKQLIAAKLNAASDAGMSEDALAAIEAADTLLCLFDDKLPYRVRPSTAAGKIMTELAAQLEGFNGGL